MNMNEDLKKARELKIELAKLSSTGMDLLRIFHNDSDSQVQNSIYLNPTIQACLEDMKAVVNEAIENGENHVATIKKFMEESDYSAQAEDLSWDYSEKRPVDFNLIRKDIINMLDYNACKSKEEKQEFFDFVDKFGKLTSQETINLCSNIKCETDEEKLFFIDKLNEVFEYNQSILLNAESDEDFEYSSEVYDRAGFMMRDLRGAYRQIVGNNCNEDVLKTIPLEILISVGNEKSIIKKFAQYEESSYFDLEQIEKTPGKIRLILKSYEKRDVDVEGFPRYSYYDFGPKKEEFQNSKNLEDVNIISIDK